MLLSAVSVLVVAQSSSEIPEGLMNNPLPFNRPVITFKNKKTKNAFLIDIAVPNTRNLAKTITDKQNKYQELANEICAMWKQNAA